VGPLTQTVVDARLLYHALLGRPAAHEAVPVRMGDLRLAVLRPYFCEMLDDDVRSRFEEALDRYRRAGARVVDVDIPHAAVTGSIYQHIVLSEAAAYHGATLETMPERYTAPVRVRLEMGRYILAEDYIRALDGREVLRKEVDTALDGHDALLLPTLPIPAPPLGATVVTVGGKDEPIRSVMLRLTQLFNLTGHPAIALPSGLTSSGLPCSIQLVGTTTDRLIDVAEACESQLSA
jgi:aspartyl-tRNA(Asn)/glutamyl-tRNA(Gln) amidotransferase subunit A